VCYFNLVAIPRSADLPQVRAVLARHNLPLEAVPEFRKPDDLPPKFDFYRLSTWRCDCGTLIGSLSQGESPPPHERLRRSLEKKGWGKHKIERWFEELEKQETKRERERTQLAGTALPEAEAWSAVLSDLLRCRAVRSLGLLQVCEDPPRELAATYRAGFGELTPELFLRVELDVFYEFRRESVAVQ